MKDQRDRLRWLVRHHIDPAPQWLRELYSGSTVWECLTSADAEDGPVEELVDRLMGVTREDRVRLLQETACKRSPMFCYLDDGHDGDCVNRSGNTRATRATPFQELAEAAAGRWDGVDAAEYVRELRDD